MADEDTPKPSDESLEEQAEKLKEEVGDITEGMMSLDANELDIVLFIQHFCLERFPAIQMMSTNYVLQEPTPEDFPGKLLARLTSLSGMTVCIYEKCIMIGVGENAFAQGSNYSRLVSAVDEVYRAVYLKEFLNTAWQQVGNLFTERAWDDIGFAATHENIEDVAWVIARLLEVPVEEFPPSINAEEVYRRMKIYNDRRKRGQIPLELLGIS